ncbi:type VI secretion system-associated protein TagF [Pseudomonas sp. JDS28PS106]|uniref:type VI secretion system-associated protein TagF n=1 Tax=Pseudomonas sp. JDS28PS106 TaxID=2497235 RepID=UPI002FD69C06
MSGPGFYGKIASRGDFVGRDLPQTFIQPWDTWLAAGMLASQQQLGSAWLDAYLVSPLWRFALAPGVCGPRAVVGGLMPSIDRVGRYFPLTLALIVEDDQSLASLIGGADQWFEQAEQALLDTLEPDTTFEAFETALRQLGRPVSIPRGATSEFAGLQRFDATTPEARLAAMAEQACVGASLWWGKGSHSIAPSLLRCQGLPATAEFGRFLLGQEASV